MRNLVEYDKETIEQKASIVDRAEALALFTPARPYQPRHASNLIATDIDHPTGYRPRH